MSEVRIEGIDYEAGLATFQLPKVFNRILGVYLKSTPGILETLATFTPDTLDEYITTVHGLKGASYGVQANQVGDLAKALEFAGKDGNIAFIQEHNQGLINETNALLARLQVYLDAQE